MDIEFDFIWGFWGTVENCPIGTHVVGFITDTAIEPLPYEVYPYDELGVTGLFVVCSGSSGLIIEEYVTYVDNSYDTTHYHSCPGGFDGARVKMEGNVWKVNDPMNCKYFDNFQLLAPWTSS